MMIMLEVQDLCRAYIDGYIQAKVTTYLNRGKVLSPELDKVKDMAVKCMEDYISHLNLSDKEKEEMKENHKQWADMTLKGIKKRLHDSDKLKKQ